jgi:hypothetical protein
MKAQIKQQKVATPKFKKMKAEPFGAHFTTRLEGANNKLICALSAVATTCTDDNRDRILV